MAAKTVKCKCGKDNQQRNNHARYQQRQADGCIGALLCPLLLSGADILTDKRGGSHGHTLHGQHDKLIQLIVAAPARHTAGPKEIDIRLYKYIGKGRDYRLNARRKTHGEDPAQNGFVNPQIVPDKAIVRGEIRSSIHEDALSLYERTAAAFREEAEAIGATCDCAYTVHLTAYHVAEDDPALLHYQRVLEQLSIPNGSKKNFGGSDCNVVRRKGIDGICIANPMHDAHTTKEWTTVLEMVQCTAIVKALMTVDTD